MCAREVKREHALDVLQTVSKAACAGLSMKPCKKKNKGTVLFMTHSHRLYRLKMADRGLSASKINKQLDRMAKTE